MSLHGRLAKIVWRLADPLLFRTALSSKRLVRLFFGIKVPAENDSLFFYDVTTVCFLSSLRRLPRPPRRVLDMGAGELALLAQLAWRRFGAEVEALELKERGVRLSGLCCQLNGSRVCVKQSDLFAAASGRYDLMTFNAPYVPERYERLTLRQLSDIPDIERRYDRGTDVGPDGTKVVARFLQDAPRFLEPDGRILLGFNAWLLTWEAFQGCLSASALRIERVDRYLGGIWRIVHLVHAEPRDVRG
jgi:release factor glutamine methyltransferase